MTKRKAKQKKQPQRRTLLQRLTRGPVLLTMALVGAIGAFVVILVISILTQGGGSIERLEGITVQGRTRGDADAPVTIIEFADFQCPHCKTFAQTVGNDIEEEYVANGLVRMEFRNMAFIGNESVAAAEGALCANEQDRFWEYHDELFDSQQSAGSGVFMPDQLKLMAGNLDLDQEAFDECLDSGRHKQLVFDERDAAEELGIGSTPYFLVQVTGSDDFERVKGGKPFDEFSDIIDQKLQEATSSP